MTTIQEMRKVINQAEETLEELYENVEEMKNRLEEMELEDKREQEQKTIYNLEIGDKFYHLNTYGDIREDVWGNYELDRCLMNVGNIYLTYEDAEDELRARRLIAKAKKSQKGFKPGWDSSMKEKHYIRYNSHYNAIETCFVQAFKSLPRLEYWPNKEDTLEFANKNEKDLIWFFTEYKGY
ncbi:hypothetical protein [Microaceticoccus formicicus]|uniref:hypothetical protein n=1 Tax=Microaceticoccus formicicus TaxID=3118105 RepID=UPI003CD013A2|nr:hypothetical protein VZL98_01605 [Peptoniphilaceae bacterium AMB_02]